MTRGRGERSIPNAARLLKDSNLLWLSLLSAALLFLAYQGNPYPYTIDIGENEDGAYVQRFHDRERNEEFSYRWSRGTSYLRLPIKGSLNSSPLKLGLLIHCWRPDTYPSPFVSIQANGQRLASFTAPRSLKASFVIDNQEILKTDTLLVEIRSDTFIPGDDPRSLGLIVDKVWVEPASTLSGFMIPPPSHVVFPTALILACYLLLRQRGLSRRASFRGAILLLVATAPLFAFDWSRIVRTTWYAKDAIHRTAVSLRALGNLADDKPSIFGHSAFYILLFSLYLVVFASFLLLVFKSPPRQR